jgi:hypothetical protein
VLADNQLSLLAIHHSGAQSTEAKATRCDGTEGGGLFRMISDALAVGSDSQHDVRNMEAELSHLLKIRSLMPSYLFDVSPG